jgi:large subunit ribosomal protein L23
MSPVKKVAAKAAPKVEAKVEAKVEDIKVAAEKKVAKKAKAVKKASAVVAERKTSQEKLINVLLTPHITEKTSLAMQNNNSYSFRVRRESSKPDIKAAVELMFNVKVAKVNVVNEIGKSRRFGKLAGRTQDIKKAYVRLAPGQTIDYEAKLKA